MESALVKSSEAPQRHPHCQVETRDMTCAYPVVIAAAGHRQFFDIGFAARGVASGFLRALPPESVLG
jgi:hypothetical protein